MSNWSLERVNINKKIEGFKLYQKNRKNKTKINPLKTIWYLIKLVKLVIFNQQIKLFQMNEIISLIICKRPSTKYKLTYQNMLKKSIPLVLLISTKTCKWLPKIKVCALFWRKKKNKKTKFCNKISNYVKLSKIYNYRLKNWKHNKLYIKWIFLKVQFRI